LIHKQPCNLNWKDVADLNEEKNIFLQNKIPNRSG
jgi:hypothetical protein